MAPTSQNRISVHCWTLYLCLLSVKIWAAHMTDHMTSEQKDALSKNITHILNKLVSTEHYDKRLRPNYGGNPVDVGVTIHVSSISAVSEVEMDFTLDMYMRQMWNDPRLRFSKQGGVKDLTIDVEYLKSIWVPDTFFPNEKKSFFHIATTHNSFLRITNDGNVTTSQRLTVTATCPMALQLFPLDSQECSLEIESYGYSTKDIKYTWFKGKKSVSMGNITLPQFAVTDFNIKEIISALSTGVYSRLICHFMFTRSIGFYMIQIYLPSILIVIISWVSFWLSRDATPARVSLGVTTVLTMTTLMTTTNAAMPKVSYIKSIDLYLGVSFLMVFSSLLEYAAVGYLNKRMRMKKEKQIRAGPQSTSGPNALSAFAGETPPLFPLHSTAAMPKVSYIKSIDIYLLTCFLMVFSSLLEYAAVGYLNKRMRMKKEKQIRAGPQSTSGPNALSVFAGGGLSSPNPPPHNPRLPLLPLHSMDRGYRPLSAPQSPPVLNANAANFQQVECDCDIEKRTMKKAIKLTTPRKRNVGVSPSAIDKYSRLVFPLIFSMFNAMYWVIYMNIGVHQLQDKDDQL